MFRLEKFPPDTLFIIHLHYDWPKFAMSKILRRLEDLSQLVVTSSNDLVLEEARRQGVAVLEVENVGRNFGALVQVPTSLTAGARFVVHLHGKKTQTNRVFGWAWNFLLWEVLTSPRTLSDAESVSKGTPFVFFVDLSSVFTESSLTWGKTEKLLRQLPLSVQGKFFRTRLLTYPIGGMFACSSDLLKEIKSFVRSNEISFEPEPIRSDGDWPHFIERSVVLLSSNIGERAICWRSGKVIDVSVC